MFINFILFGIIGIFGSLLATAIKRSISARRLTLNVDTSLALFPMFGLIAFLYPLIAIRLGDTPWYLRGAIYMLAFFIVQYLIGLGLTKLGRCPWNYSGKGSVGGLVSLSDAPILYTAGLAIEWIYPHVKIAATALS